MMDLLRKSKLDSALVEICSSRVLISLRHCACGAVDDDPVDVYFWKYITEKLEACGLKQSKFDPFLFIGPDVMCIVYVDDFILESRHSQD